MHRTTRSTRPRYRLVSCTQLTDTKYFIDLGLVSGVEFEVTILAAPQNSQRWKLFLQSLCLWLHGELAG